MSQSNFFNIKKNTFKLDSKIACIILCGGKGSRLKIHGKKYNKTMLKLKNKPIIFYLINYLLHSKINNIILPLGYKGSDVDNYVRLINKKFFNSICNISAFFTGINTSILNRIKKVLHNISSNNKLLVIMNGDSIYNFNLKKIIRFHNKSNKSITLCCTSLNINFGFLNITDKKKAKKFTKSIAAKKISNNVNNNFLFYSGLFIIDHEYLINKIKLIKNDFEISLFNLAIEENKLHFYFDKGDFFQINDETEYEYAKNKFV